MPSRTKTKSTKEGSKTNIAASSNGDQEPWREVQTRVYTNWVNDKLKDAHLHVDYLAKDLGDGLILIKLLELLSGKKLPGKYARLAMNILLKAG